MLQFINFWNPHFLAACGIWETVFAAESDIFWAEIGWDERSRLDLKNASGPTEAKKGWRDGMKKMLLGAMALAVVSMAAPASAADLAPRPYAAPPPMIAVIYDWSGFYIGLNGGGGSAHKCWTANNVLGVVIPAVAEGCHNATGGMLGGQLGYRWQASNWVFGLEAQGDWANFKGSNTSLAVPFALVTNQTKIDAFGLFTGQIGYAWSNVLWYVKGGAAVANDTYQGITTIGAIPFDRVSEGRWGGVVGTGLEVGFAPNWSVAFEYDHIFMGTHSDTFTFVGTNLLSRIDSIKQDVDMGTIRVNYRWGGPVIAKY
jgi:outer membrane immunogenic protein